MPNISPVSPASLPTEAYSLDRPLQAAALTPAGIALATEKFTTVEDCVKVWEGKAYVPSLARCIRELGQKKVEAMVKMYLIRLNMVTNAARPMTEQVIESIVPVIVEHITKDMEVTITLADLKIVFDRAMKGYYGTPYGGFTCQDICGWFDRYQREKIEAIDAVEARRKHDELSGPRHNIRAIEIAKFKQAREKYLTEKMKNNE